MDDMDGAQPSMSSAVSCNELQPPPLDMLINLLHADIADRHQINSTNAHLSSIEASPVRRHGP